ncbi:MAG: hypothetical protein R3360_06440, partial [Alphaproteobacteria bacterium]|nr:hypothetical protein [Alphaproteobacteria bacterium]
QGGRITALMEAGAAGEILTFLEDDVAIQILRSMEEPDRARLLSVLPLGLSRHLSAALGYSPQLVGAWVNREVLIFAESTRAGDALKEMRSSGRPVEQVYLVDQRQKYSGVATAAALVLADAETPLSHLSIDTPDPVSETASLGSVAGLTVWDTYTGLPVIDRLGRVIGELTRRGLRLGLIEVVMPSRQSSTVPLLMDVGAAYLDVVGHMIDEALPLPDHGTAPGRRKRSR